MRCMSCGAEMGANARVWNKIVICPSCLELAEKAERDIEREIDRAKQMAMNWLQQHAMRGGLLAGGDGGGTQPGNDVPALGLRWLQGPQAPGGTVGADEGRDGAASQLGPEGGVHSVPSDQAHHPEQQPGRPAASGTGGSSGGCVSLEIRASELLAWSTEARTEQLDQHLLVATPRLALSQESALRLAAGWEYDRLFKHATITPGLGMPTPFQIVHGGFELFRNGKPDIVDFACVVLNPLVSAPNMTAVIHRTAEMLK